MTEREIFIATLHQSGTADRAAFLDRACAGETSLRERVVALIDEHDRLGDFLETPDPVVAQARERNCEEPGSVIGPYKLVEQIGEGGMGLVFMAEQSQPVRRRVALKVLKPGLDTRHVLARFEAERQALALMDHPHIAKVFDAGTTPAGRPYFVMELVRGVPITEFCDQRRFDPRRRLELFVEVCRAVQHAHQKGVIHRDLKPSNVLVTLHDTVAVPKVIDFGIAKATGERLTDRTLVTHFTQMVGTPLYMSPEQAEMNGLDVDTRSDVYALGVLLYELLTGATTFCRERLKSAGCDEMRRILREEEPLRPSRQVATLGAAAVATVAEQRGVDARQFGHLLRGDLDWIVMKALEKDRNRRYESASAFAQDVDRYLAGEAVEARPPSAAYRLRKFAGRNRAAVLASVVVAAALVAATGVSTWQAVKAMNAERRADERADNERRARDDGAREAAVAKAVSDFLQVDLLRLADLEVQTEFGFVGNPNLTVREALHRAAAKIGERFLDQPLVEAEIRATIGLTYMAVGDDEIGLTHLTRSLALYEAHLDPHHPQLVTALHRLALVYGRMLQWPRSIALWERAVSTASAALGPDHPTTLESVSLLAGAYVYGGRQSEGIRLYEKVLAKRRESLGPDHPITEKAAVNLADRLRIAGRWQESIVLLEPLLLKAESTFGPDHKTTMDRTDLLARAYQHVGRIDEALVMLQQVLDFRRAVLGPENNNTVHSLILLSRAYWSVGKADNGEGLLREAVRLSQKNEGVHGAIIHAQNQWHLANNLLLQKRYAEAEVVARMALTAVEKHRPNDWNRFWTASLVGGALLGQGEHAAAEPFLIQGYEGLLQREETIQRPQYGRLTEAGERLARLYDETRRPDKARAVRDSIPRLP